MKNVNVKKAFTLIEVILAIVVVAVIMGIVIPKVMDNADKAEIKQVISSDVRSIIQAAADWKRTDRVLANGNFANLTAAVLDSRLPSANDVNSTAGREYIKSSRFNGGCHYFLENDNTSATTSDFRMGIDCSEASTTFSWSNKLNAYAVQSFQDTAISMSRNSGATLYTDAVIDTDANCNDLANNISDGCIQGIVQ